MEHRDDVRKSRGLREYGDVEFADNVNKKYPIDTPEHIRAAWNYIHIPRDYEKYSQRDVETIKNRIIKAWKQKMSSDGLPSAEK